MRALVAPDMRPLPRSTLETVDLETPLRLATSMIVGRCEDQCDSGGMGAGPARPLDRAARGMGQHDRPAQRDVAQAVLAAGARLAALGDRRGELLELALERLLVGDDA